MLYDFFRWVGVITGYPFKWLYLKTKVYYENEKATRRPSGGALVISNHFGTLDFVQNTFLFFPRKLFVVASEHAFRNPLIRFGMKFFGGIQANRETKSVYFVSRSVRELKKGRLVQIFPEGHNTDDGSIRPFYPSYLLIAFRANVPILPVVSDGNYGLFKRVHLIVGEPIRLTDHHSSPRLGQSDVERLNAIVFEKVLLLQKMLAERTEADKRKKRRP